MTSVVNRVVSVMLDGEVTPEMTRVAMEAARVTNDPGILAQVASLPDLPDDVAAVIDKDKSAKVMAARLSRPDVTLEEQLAAARDRRVSVASAVAEVHGLPPEVYQKVVQNHTSASVLLTVAENSSVSMETRLEAVGKLSGIDRPNRKVTAQLMSLCSSLPGAADELVRKAGPHSDLFTLAANSGYLSEECIKEVGDIVLEEIKRDVIGSIPHWVHRDVVRSLASLAAYKELDPQVVNAAMQHLTDSETTFVRRALSTASHSKAPMLQSLCDWAQVKSSEDLEPYVDLCIESNPGLGRALMGHQFVSDEQFVRVAIESDYRYYSGGAQELKTLGTSPLRFAALLFNRPWAWVDEVFERSGNPTEVVGHLVTWMRNSRLTWYHLERLMASRYFTVDHGAKLPTSLLARGSESRVVAEYIAQQLTQNFGHDPQAWVTALSFIPNVDGTLQEAFDTAVAVLDSAPSAVESMT